MSAPLMRLVSTPYCQAVMLEDWNASPGRFFVGFRRRHDFTSLLGHGVVDEFRTISGPILVAPRQLIGGVYDAGMRLADLRDADAPIDQGWPPLSLGLDARAPRRTENWQQQIIEAIKSGRSDGTAGWSSDLQSTVAGGHLLDLLRCRTGEQSQLAVIATDAPMLPEQLERLADRERSPITVAVSTGNRLPRVANKELHRVSVVSERDLKKIGRVLAGL